MEKIVQLTNVTKYYGRGNMVTKALDGISFAVGEGEFTAIMGASGSGKSTLLNVIATIDRVSSGDICIRGKHLPQMKEKDLAVFRREELGFIFQDYNLLDTLTIEENIVLPLNLKRQSLVKTKKELERVAQALGVVDQLAKFPWELSGGQRQRAACARALITNPALVLADEPTGALDSKNSKLLMQSFAMMNEKLHSTILMVTHDAIVGSYAERVLFLKDGKIFSEFNRGERTRQEYYRAIVSNTIALGGESNVF